MEPISLGLSNFLSYRQETVDLTAVSCAALVGENGAGKSSLLDALTWCLFGQGTKGGVRDLDNYVTRGETECRVDLAFRLNGQTYRVIRGRATKGKSSLEFFLQEGGDWRPLSGKTIAETQVAIDAVLRMNYPTFTSSSLILQGQADSLTANMTDAERKEVLATILGLDVWDALQERAREKGRQLKAELAAVEQNRQRLLACSSEKPALEARQTEVLEQVEAKAAEVFQVSAAVTDLEAKVRAEAAARVRVRVAVIEADAGHEAADGSVRQARRGSHRLEARGEVR
jgi:exonuclease SbcC